MAQVTQKLTLQQISPGDALDYLQRADIPDPAGLMCLQSACNAGICYELAGDVGRVVFVVRVSADVLWVTAMAGDFPGAGTAVCAVLDELAAGRQIGCQTAKPGFARLARMHGYETAGWILRKRSDTHL